MFIATPSANVRAEEQAALVRAALAKVPDETDRALLRLRFFEGLSLRQAARQLGVSYDAARERYRRALTRLEGDLARLL